MEPPSVQAITSAVAPVVMVSAAGLLFMGIQAKNLHLADRLRALAMEYRELSAEPAHRKRRQQVQDQLRLFERRIRLSQRSLEFLYIAMVCFVMTSLLLASSAWVGGRPLTAVVALLFLGGVAFFLIALVVEFLEMRAGLRTIGIELDGALREGSHD